MRHVVRSLNSFDTSSFPDRNPALTDRGDTEGMIILRWIFVVAIVGFVVAALALVDIAGHFVRAKGPSLRTSTGSRIPRVLARNS